MDLSNLKYTAGLMDSNKSQVMQDINAITGLTTNSVSSLQALIFPQKGINEDIDPTTPQNVGITAIYNGKKEGFVFDLKEDYRLSLNSDITDHYVENNRAIQDHIALKPITIEVSGKVSEVNLNTPYDEEGDVDFAKKALNAVDSYYNRLGSLPQFAPNIINQARDITNTAKGVYDTYKTFSSFVKKASGEQQQTRQSKIVSRFRDYWANRTKFVIVTPFCVLENMYILDFSANQPKNTKYVTEIKIKFKQIREAEVITVKSKFKSLGAEIAANKKHIQDAPSFLIQDDIPLPERELRLAGDFVKQTLNVAQKPAVITQKWLSQTFEHIRYGVANKVNAFTNISTAGMSTTEVANSQVLIQNMSAFPLNGMTTTFLAAPKVGL